MFLLRTYLILPKWQLLRSAQFDLSDNGWCPLVYNGQLRDVLRPHLLRALLQVKYCRALSILYMQAFYYFMILNLLYFLYHVAWFSSSYTLFHADTFLHFISVAASTSDLSRETFFSLSQSPYLNFSIAMSCQPRIHFRLILSLLAWLSAGKISQRPSTVLRQYLFYIIDFNIDCVLTPPITIFFADMSYLFSQRMLSVLIVRTLQLN